jgi:hypothetical protein
MQRILLGFINTDFDATEELLAIYSEFIKYLKKKEYNEAVHQLFIDLKKVYYLVRKEVLYINPQSIGKANKMCLNETYSRDRRQEFV